MKSNSTWVPLDESTGTFAEEVNQEGDRDIRQAKQTRRRFLQNTAVVGSSIILAGAEENDAWNKVINREARDRYCSLYQGLDAANRQKRLNERS